jgi:hypothetical protein
MKNLEKHIPKKSVHLITNWIKELEVIVKISKSRTSKLGDFRVLKKGEIEISINQDLNKYAFFITLTHEIAHAFVWLKHKKSVKPHGKEWKSTYKKLMLNFLNLEIFPDDVLRALSKHLINPKASTSTDLELHLVLKKYDYNKKLIIADILDGETFSIHNGKKFVKLHKIRKRYKCMEVESARIYLFNPLTTIELTQ